MTVAVLAPIVIGRAAVAGYWYLVMRRRRQWHAEWEATAAGLRDLDRELDRVWARERLRRPR
ncbi:MAG TPA: hypothetical protein VF060_22000 [Trebonia sp.]